MTDIHLYNTRTRTKEPFRPLDPTNVRMYVCGPTVYDRAHIGNARPVVVFDVLYRLLRHVYGDDAVTYARNFTDVDDKINARAAETGRSIREITDETIGWYHEDMDALGALRPTVEPRCTEFIPQMVAMTQTLIDQGHAYAAEGHVLFAVDTYKDYGKLSRRSLDDMVAGARVEVAPYKKNPMDFVLWKPSTGDQPGWDSPWGRGRPGWHIECSAMAQAILGDVFDIHGGGIDLQFPHHENEVAQSCCANHTPVMANVWMHNGFLQVEGEKMAKSLGNFFTVKDLLDKGVPGEVIRFVLLSAHYRSPLDWTEKRVEEATTLLSNWARLKRTAGDEGYLASAVDGRPDPRLVDALSEDLNTPKAIAVLHELAAEARLAGATDPNGAKNFFATLDWLGLDPEGVLKPAIALSVKTATRVVELRDALDAARSQKDYARADAIRKVLISSGVLVKTTKSGTDIEYGPDFDAAKLEALR